MPDAKNPPSTDYEPYLVDQRSPSFSTTEVAKLLQMSTQTVQRLVDHGELAAWKTPGGHRRISTESVRQFVTGRKLLNTPFSPTPAGAEPVVPRPGAEGWRVLVVDDDHYQLELLQAMLAGRDKSLHIQVTDNGFQALLLIGQEVPDLLITDVFMEGMDGLEMLRAVRSNPKSSHLPAVAISGLSAEEVLDRGGLPSGVKFVPKPINPDRLFKAMNDLIGTVVV